jgi:hypothetical protein
MIIRKNFPQLASIFLINCLLFVPLLFAGCASDSPETETPPELVQDAIVIVETPSEEARENPPDQSKDSVAEVPPGIASYEITFKAVWSAESHAGYYASNAHFSPFIAYSHSDKPEAQIFAVGSTASPGIEQMAETGATALLEEELTTRITAGSVLTFAKGPVFNSPGEVQADLEFSQDYSQVTFVSMIAPSPDWFVAAQGDLFVDGQWLDQLVLDLISYDAGTDSGPELTSPDADTNPKVPVTFFPDHLQRLGTITLTRILPDV